MASPKKTPKITLKTTEGGLHCKVGRAAGVLVTPKPCFPLSDPGTHLSLRDAEDLEVAHVAHPNDLDADSKTALLEALAEVSSLIEITAVRLIESGHQLREWEVETTGGLRIFQTSLDHWPRALESGAFLIQDVAEDLYHIPNPEKLDAESRRLLAAYVG